MWCVESELNVPLILHRFHASHDAGNLHKYRNYFRFHDCCKFFNVRPFRFQNSCKHCKVSHFLFLLEHDEEHYNDYFNHDKNDGDNNKDNLSPFCKLPAILLWTYSVNYSVALLKIRIVHKNKISPKTLPKALRTQALTTLTSNFG